MTSPSTSFFSNCPRGGSRNPEGEDRHQQDRDGQDVEGPAPAVRATHLRGDEAHQQRAEGHGRAAAHPHGRVDPAAHADRVGVGQQGAVDAVGTRLRDAGAEAGQEEHEDVHGQARGEHHQPEHEGGPADDGRAAVTVGQPSHGDDAQDQEAARDAGHEGDGAGRDVKRGLDVRRQDGQSRGLEVVQGDDDGQDDEGTGLPTCAGPRAGWSAPRRPRAACPRGTGSPASTRPPAAARPPNRPPGAPGRPRSELGASAWPGPPASARSTELRSPRPAPPPRVTAHGAATRWGGPARIISTQSLTQERASRSWGRT